MEQAFGVIARLGTAGDNRFTAALQPGEQHRRHRLRAEDVDLMVDGAELLTANEGRQPALRNFVDDVGSRLAQRLDDPRHRTPAQQFVAVDAEFAARRAGKESHENARGRRRVAWAQRRFLLGQLEAAQAAATDHVRRVSGLPDVDPELPENAEIAFDIVGMGNVVQRTRPVREGGGEARRVGRWPCLPEDAKRSRGRL